MWQSLAFSIKIVQLSPHWKHFYARVGTFPSLKTAILERNSFTILGNTPNAALEPANLLSATPTIKWACSLLQTYLVGKSKLEDDDGDKIGI